MVASNYSHSLPSSVGQFVGIFKMLENKKPLILMAYVINMIPATAPIGCQAVIQP